MVPLFGLTITTILGMCPLSLQYTDATNHMQPSLNMDFNGIFGIKTQQLRSHRERYSSRRRSIKTVY